MKCLTLIVNRSTQGDIIEALRALPEVSTYTISHGEGHYGDGVPPFESADDEIKGYVPRIRIDLILEDETVSKVLERVKQCSVCTSKLGIYWTSTVDTIGDL